MLPRGTSLDGPLRRIVERKSPWIGVQPPCDFALLDVCGHGICIPTDWDQDTVRCGECHDAWAKELLRP